MHIEEFESSKINKTRVGHCDIYNNPRKNVDGLLDHKDEDE
jgi:hypothetical protein